MEPMTTRRSTFTLVIIGILIVGLLAVMVLLRKPQEIRYKAAPAASLSFVPAAITKAPNEQFTVDVKMNPGTNQVTTADLYITYDQNFLEGIEITAGELFPQTVPNPNLPGTIGNGTAHIVLSVPTTEPITQEGIIARITLKALKETANTAIYFAQNTNVSAIGETGSVATILEEAQVTIRPEIPKDTILSIYSDISETDVNTEFTMNINIDTGVNNITATSLKINYDQTKLEGIEIAKGSFLPNCINCTANNGQIGNGTATITLGIGANDQPKNGQGTLAVITFQAISAGTTVISIDASSLVAVSGGANFNVVKELRNFTLNITGDLASATPLPSEPSPTPLATPEATPETSPGIGGGGGGCAKATPSAPYSLTAVSNQIGKVNLNWGEVSLVTHYGIMYGVESGKYLYGAVNVGNVTSYTVNGLAPGKSYYFAVFAVNDCVASGNSNEAYVKVYAGSVTGSVKPTGAPVADNYTASPAPDFVPVNSEEFTKGVTPFDLPYVVATIEPLEIAQASILPDDTKAKGTGYSLLSPLGGIFLVIASLFVGAFFILMKRQ